MMPPSTGFLKLNLVFIQDDFLSLPGPAGLIYTRHLSTSFHLLHFFPGHTSNAANLEYCGNQRAVFLITNQITAFILSVLSCSNLSSVSSLPPHCSPSSLKIPIVSCLKAFLEKFSCLSPLSTCQKCLTYSSPKSIQRGPPYAIIEAGASLPTPFFFSWPYVSLHGIIHICHKT